MFESLSKNKSLKQYQSFLILKFRLAPKMPVFLLKNAIFHALENKWLYDTMSMVCYL